MSRASPLRILHLTTAAEAGGLSRYICDLSQAMREQGHDVRIAGTHGPWQSLFTDAGIEWINVPLAAGPIGLWRAIRQLRRHLAARPVDVIHSHYRRTTAVARWLQKSHSPPVLYTVHLSDMPLKRWGRRWTDFGDRTHVASEEARRWSADVAGVPARQIAMIPHGVRVEKWPVPDASTRAAARQQFGLAPSDRVAAYVGRLDTPKNEEWLIDLAAGARQRAMPLTLLVAGDGPHRVPFLAQITRQNLEQHVRWVGELPDPLPVYHAADAFLLASAREGFSLACAEAMCAGVPVLRTRTAGAAELIVENITGRSTPIDRAAFIAAALEFLSDPAALARMGRAAAEHIRRHFSFDLQLQRTIDLYRELAAMRPEEPR